MKKILYAVLAATVLLTMLSGCMTPLTKATINGNTQTVRQLLAEKKFSQKDLNRALYEATSSDRHDIVKMLIDKGADVNSQPWADPIAPLFIASYRGHPKPAAVLLEHGANIYQKGSIVHAGGLFGSIKTFRITPLAVAAWKGHSNVVSIILNKAADPGIAVETALVDLEILASRFPEAKSGQVMLQRRLAKTSEPDLSATAFHQKTPAVSPAAMPFLAQIDMTDTSLDLGAYHALVIGSNDYQNLPKLRTPINDALAITHLLQNAYGFKVRLLTNATRSDILLAINAYRRELTPRDNLLIYYAGHGWLDRDADQGYWLPVNSERENQVEWVSNSSVTSAIRALKAKHVMVVADSCYSGKLTRGLHITQRTPDYLKKMSQKKARVVLSSGGLEPVLDQGGEGNNSVFASAFIKALSQNKGVLDGTTLFSQIREQVAWNADQTPEYSNIHKAGHDGGDFLFVRANKP